MGWSELDALVDEAIVDCYGDDEQLTGLFTKIEDHLAMPFATQMLGVEVSVRHVESVAATIKERAAAAGMSLSAYVARELAGIAARPTNAEIVQRLKTRDRSAGPSTIEIVEAVWDSRR